MNVLVALSVLATLLVCVPYGSCAPQVQPRPLVSGSLPTDAEIKELLENKDTVNAIVDCLIAPYYDAQNCDPRLERAHAQAEDFFKTNQKCSEPKCTPEENKQVKTFIDGLRLKDRREYTRLTKGIIDRATSYLYYDDY